MERIGTLETIEQTPGAAWRGGKTYIHVTINHNQGSAIKIERNITAAQFKALLDEGGWFKGSRKFLGATWPYMFRYKDAN